MSFKNTVASCPNEIKEFVAELKASEGHKYESRPEIDYSLIENRPLWYLECLLPAWPEHAQELIEVASKPFSEDLMLSKSAAQVQVAL